MLGNTKTTNNRTIANQTTAYQIPPESAEDPQCPNIAAARGIFLRIGLVLYVGLSLAGIAVFAAKNAPRTVPSKSMPGVRPYTYKTFTVTAYCPCEKCCGRWAKITPRVTASGHKIKPGDRFAAAPKGYQFGQELDIPGYGSVKIEDRGGAIKGNKLDVFFPSHQAALEWGRKELDVKVYMN